MKSERIEEMLDDVAYKVVVVSQLELRLERDFNRKLTLSRHNSRDGVEHKGITIVRASSNALTVEVESEWNVLLVDDLDGLFVMATDEKRSVAQLAGLKQDVGLNNLSDNEELLGDVLRWDLEKPARLVFADRLRGVLEDHFELLARKDQTLRGDASEDWLLFLLLVDDLLPFELVTLTGRVGAHEALGVADVGA